MDTVRGTHENKLITCGNQILRNTIEQSVVFFAFYFYWLHIQTGISDTKDRQQESEGGPAIPVAIPNSTSVVRVGIPHRRQGASSGTPFVWIHAAQCDGGLLARRNHQQAHPGKLFLLMLTPTVSVSEQSEQVFLSGSISRNTHY